MDAKKLQLPVGVLHAQYIDNMREIVVYDVAWDAYKGRWDTLINGRQSFVVGCSLPDEDMNAFAERFRPIAKAAFEAQERN